MTTTTPTTAKSPAQARLAASPAPARHEEIRRTAPNVAPPVDIYETEKAYVLLADMPGVSTEGLDVQAAGHLLTIQGRAARPEGVVPDYQEFELPDHRRAFTLSDDLDTERIAARLHDARADSIVRQLTRRDGQSRSDYFQVYLDPYYDRRSGFYFGVNSAGTLFRFNVNSPSTVTTIGAVGFVPEGIDFRPSSNTLYAIDIGPNTSQLYTININNGMPTAVGANFASSGAGYNLTGNQTFGFDFNPTTLQGDGSMRMNVRPEPSGATERLDRHTTLAPVSGPSCGSEAVATNVTTSS